MHENPRLARRCIPLLYNGTVHSRPTEKKKKRPKNNNPCGAPLFHNTTARSNRVLEHSSPRQHAAPTYSIGCKCTPNHTLTPNHIFMREGYDDLAPFLDTAEGEAMRGQG